ncbi:hypothetical protein OESDEN_18887 [Oesophagostomum dentatum]|uniref:Uncharacterized protein n=1 Tax=Oesophagostomum dentatum TaxID=61180 RepID=A0A0B1SD01_OESDE|nr:hypothetical protein OESDEN_18887 [Oesophagostomum dentatum]
MDSMRRMVKHIVAEISSDFLLRNAMAARIRSPAIS